VLVDAGSASASEVLAGALADNGRATVVGSRTFGKGSVQTVLPLGNGDSVKLPTARYYTPDGTSIQATGIVPEVVFQSTDAGVDGEGSGYGVPTGASRPGRREGREEGGSAGEALGGDGYIGQALAELKARAAAGCRSAWLGREREGSDHLLAG